MIFARIFPRGKEDSLSDWTLASLDDKDKRPKLGTQTVRPGKHPEQTYPSSQPQLNLIASSPAPHHIHQLATYRVYHFPD